MKKFLKAISGKKALYVIMALTGIGMILEIITAIRVDGYRFDFVGFGILCCCITCWAVSLEEKEKKKKEENK